MYKIHTFFKLKKQKQNTCKIILIKKQFFTSRLWCTWRIFWEMCYPKNILMIFKKHQKCFFFLLKISRILWKPLSKSPTPAHKSVKKPTVNIVKYKIKQKFNRKKYSFHDWKAGIDISIFSAVLSIHLSISGQIKWILQTVDTYFILININVSEKTHLSGIW